MKKRILFGFLSLCLFCELCACAKPTEIGTSSVSESPSEEYTYSVISSSSEEIADYSQYIRRTTEWLFANAQSYTCDTVWASTAIEVSGKKDTPEASLLFPTPFAADVDLEDATEVAKLAISAIMLGYNPKDYISGIDLTETLLNYYRVGGWFSGKGTEDTGEPLSDADSVAPEEITELVTEAPENALEDTLWCMIALNMINKDYDRASCGTWLYSQMHKDGSMAFDSTLGDVEATALCILALSNNTDDEGKMTYNGCMEYLIGSCNSEGYFVDADENAQKNPSDQAMAIAAVISAGENIYTQRWMRNGSTIVDGLLSFQNENGSFSAGSEEDCTISAKSLFALLCAQADSMIWANYAMADILPEPTVSE